MKLRFYFHVTKSEVTVNGELLKKVFTIVATTV